MDCIVGQARRHCTVERDAAHCRLWHRYTHGEHAFFMANHAPYKPPDPPPAPAPASAAPAPAPASGYSSSDLGAVPGVPYSFASCVAFRESTDGQLSSNIYGITSMWGYYDGMPIAAQKALFAKIYAEQGVAPWQPWDGCG
jgi:hypothetical protein